MPAQPDAILAQSIAAYLAKPFRQVRVLLVVAFILLAVVAVILIGVSVSGATGSEDVGVPAAIAAFLALVCGISVPVSAKRLRDIQAIEDALSTGDTSQLTKAMAVNFIDHGLPGVEFHVKGARLGYALPLQPDAFDVVAAQLNFDAQGVAQLSA